jgi:outer membrane immunogenic protein
MIASALAGDISGARGGLKDVYVPVNNWAGFYIGVNAGGAFDASKVSNLGVTTEEETFLVSTQKFDSQFIGGGQIGYNFQWGQWVLGIEGDIDASTNLIHYLASVRGRAGYAWADYLIYATGGVGFIGFDHRVTAIETDVGAVRFSNNKNETGFVVGGGIEKKIWGNWSVGVEGLFYGFDKDVFFTTIPGEPDEFVRSTLEPNVWVVRARLNSYLVPAYVPLK